MCELISKASSKVTPTHAWGRGCFYVNISPFNFINEVVQTTVFDIGNLTPYFLHGI